MANTDNLITLANMVTVNDVSVADMGVTDIFNDAPVISQLAADVASHGTDHKYLKESGAPTVGFRGVNLGRPHSKSADTLVQFPLKILDASHHQDCKLADSYTRGGASAWMARESRRHLRAGFAQAEAQIFYGTGNAASGFTGLADNATLNALAGAMVIDAGGAVGAASWFDCWLIRSTPDHANAEVIVGNDGNIELREYIRQFVQDGNGDYYPAYFQQIDAWLGFKVGGAFSVARIVNIDGRANATANTLTDDLLDRAFELFPESAPPTHIVMNRRGRKQLRQSRTATRADGQKAPLPTEWEGIPIITTNSCKYYTAKVA